MDDKFTFQGWYMVDKYTVVYFFRDESMRVIIAKPEQKISIIFIIHRLIVQVIMDKETNKLKKMETKSRKKSLNQDLSIQKHEKTTTVLCIIMNNVHFQQHLNYFLFLSLFCFDFTNILTIKQVLRTSLDTKYVKYQTEELCDESLSEIVVS